MLAVSRVRERRLVPVVGAVRMEDESTDVMRDANTTDMAHHR